MKLVYSFDDGRADNMRVFDEILKPRSVPATINIATAYVDGSISPENRPCPNEAMGVDDVKRLAQSPLIELAGHGDQHLNTPEDLKKGLEKLRGWVSEDGTSLCSTDIAGIASPHSYLTAREVSEKEQTYRDMGVEYFRIGPGESYRGINRIAGKLSRMMGTRGTFLRAYGDIEEHIDRGFVLRSVPILHNHNIDQICALINENLKKGTDLILMFHSILKPGEPYYDDSWSFDYESFERLTDWCLDRDGVDIVTCAAAHRGELTR